MYFGWPLSSSFHLGVLEKSTAVSSLVYFPYFLTLFLLSVPGGKRQLATKKGRYVARKRKCFLGI